MLFSNRTPGDMSDNSIARVQNNLGGASLLDLTQSNPTRCGFHYPSGLLEALKGSEALVYEAQPFGLLRARQAVAGYLNRGGASIDPRQVILTSSTSEAYSFIFKLLGDPGDSFLVPHPGYPLLEHLLRLEGLKAVPYAFQMEPGWPLDRNKTARAIGSDAKGIIAVNPHNPTGCFLSASDQSFLWEMCQKHKMAYLSDEVFSDFAYAVQGAPKSSAEVLSFRLGGLSKSLGLPQLKLSWIILEGPRELLEECGERLELIADTYLSVNTPVQLALPDLLDFAPSFQSQVLERVLSNRTFLERCLGSLAGIKVWPAQGGWYALVELVSSERSDEEWVIEIMKKQRVLVQPGGFYDFQKGCFLVLSLLPPAVIFEEGVLRLKAELS